MKISKKILYLIFGGAISIASFVQAHEVETEEILNNTNIRALTWKIIGLTTIIIAVFVFAAIFKKNKSKKSKLIIFLGIITPMVLGTIYLAGSTIYFNLTSESKGPVHWHADFEIYICDELIDLTDPSGLSNRIGTSLFHEHGDFRIHVEGTIFKYEDVNLPSFFEVIGGELTEELILVPTNQGFSRARNGDLCNGEPGVLNVFAYKTDNGIVTQEKIEDIESYRMNPSSNIPPGDCIIFEFSPEKQSTDKICETYDIAIQQGDLTYGS